VIVITHHAPSKQSLPVRFEEDIISAAYASRLDNLVDRSQARLWIHGHVHEAQDYVIGRTRVLCNPRGYPGELNPSFVLELVATI
jgi:Icc-related predicted phosphoesterase